MAAITEIAHGLQFPEGPVALSDGSVLLVEIARQTLSRVHANGTVSVVATLGGGPNGAAIGPDGRCYVCNNGGFAWHQRGDALLPGLQAVLICGQPTSRCRKPVVSSPRPGHALVWPCTMSIAKP